MHQQFIYQVRKRFIPDYDEYNKNIFFSRSISEQAMPCRVVLLVIDSTVVLKILTPGASLHCGSSPQHKTLACAREAARCTTPTSTRLVSASIDSLMGEDNVDSTVNEEEQDLDGFILV